MLRTKNILIREDAVGIVEKVEEGIVYTVEGNSGNACRERHDLAQTWHRIGRIMALNCY